MAGTIKLFQSVENSYKTIGIYTLQSNQFFDINFRKVFFSLNMLLMVISYLGHFLVEKNVESLYSFISGLLCLIYFFVTIWQMPNLLKVFKAYEKFIERSKQNPISVFFVEQYFFWSIYHSVTENLDEIHFQDWNKPNTLNWALKLSKCLSCFNLASFKRAQLD